MDSILNQKVEHIKFGKGFVTNEENYKIDIEFGAGLGKKSFLYPDAFEKFLKLDNELLQKECFDLAVNKRENLEKEKEMLHIEQIRLEQEQRAKAKPVKGKGTKKKVD